MPSRRRPQRCVILLLLHGHATHDSCPQRPRCLAQTHCTDIVPGNALCATTSHEHRGLIVALFCLSVFWYSLFVVGTEYAQAGGVVWVKTVAQSGWWCTQSQGVVAASGSSEFCRFCRSPLVKKATVKEKAGIALPTIFLGVPACRERRVRQSRPWLRSSLPFSGPSETCGRSAYGWGWRFGRI